MRASKRPLKVAVVGAGIAGLSAAWHLAERDVDVSLFEAASRLGGHTHTHVLDVAGGRVAVDTGFIVFNETHYPEFSRWLRSLDVASMASDMSFAVRDEVLDLEYGTGDFGALLARPSQVVRPGFWRLWRDLSRFYRSEQGAGDLPEHVTLGDYLRQEGYSSEFIDAHMVPMCAALWSQPASASGDMSLAHVLEFMRNHAMLQVRGRPEWKVVRGGSHAYLAAFREQFGGAIHTDCGPVQVRRSGSGAGVRHRATWRDFDAVVVACHADQALQAVIDLSEREAEVLAALSFRRNRVYLHGDPSFMPRRRRAWSSWNVVRDGFGQHTITYWMNRLQRLEVVEPFFVTLNPPATPSRVYWQGEYSHPCFTGQARAAQREWTRLSSSVLSFAGAYWGAGFHEDGFTSGRRAADAVLQRKLNAA